VSLDEAGMKQLFKQFSFPGELTKTLDDTY